MRPSSSIRDRYGDVEILFNNSGGPPPSTAAGQPVELWRQQFEAMVVGVIALTDRVLPAMRAARVGADHHQHQLGRRRADAEPRALECAPALARRVVEDARRRGGRRRHHRQRGHPRPASRPVASARSTRRVRRARARPWRPPSPASIAAIPVGRYGDPDEFAAAVAFLAGQPASYITGATLRIDGGQIPSI